MIFSIRKKISLYKLCGAIAGFLLAAGMVAAYTQYSPGALLQTGDVTTGIIRDGTILNVDISASAAIAYAKLNLGNSILNGDISSSTVIMTEKIATSSVRQFMNREAQSFDGVKTFTSIPATTGGNCAAANDLCNKTYVDANAAAFSFTTTFGENATTGQVMFLATTTKTISTEYTATGYANADEFGRVAANQVRVAESFMASSTINISSVKIDLLKIGTPTDNVRLTIHQDSGANLPTEQSIATSSLVAAASLTGSFSTQTVTFSTNFVASTSIRYWLVLDRDGANDNVNYYQAGLWVSDKYANGCHAVFTSSWAAPNCGQDIFFVEQEQLQGGRAYLATAIVDNNKRGFLGIANATTSAGSTGALSMGGLVNNYSAQGGTYYFLSNVAGQLSTVAGDNSIKIGFSPTTTKLFIQNLWQSQ